jgi:hypothetical protein
LASSRRSLHAGTLFDERLDQIVRVRVNLEATGERDRAQPGLWGERCEAEGAKDPWCFAGFEFGGDAVGERVPLRQPVCAVGERDVVGAAVVAGTGRQPVAVRLDQAEHVQVRPELGREDLAYRDPLEQRLHLGGVFLLPADAAGDQERPKPKQDENSRVLGEEVEVETSDRETSDLALGAAAVIGLHDRRHKPVRHGALALTPRPQSDLLQVGLPDRGLAVYRVQRRLRQGQRPIPVA